MIIDDQKCKNILKYNHEEKSMKASFVIYDDTLSLYLKK